MAQAMAYQINLHVLTVIPPPQIVKEKSAISGKFTNAAE